jgi:RNA polymerase sigma-70 factor, ECF subfamily
VPVEIERLYREHRAGLVRLVERELRDHHDAEDVVQTAFLDAQRALEHGAIPRNPRAWLTAIALNAARRLRRRRLNAEPLEEYAAQEASRMPEIRAALTNLPSEQRTAVLYRDVVGLSYGETAEQMGTSVNAVTMLLHRGRQRLRQTLGVTTGGLGLWRGLRRAGMPQAAAAKGAAAVVVAAGLATAGTVTARAVAPIRTGMTAAVMTTRSGSPANEARRTPRHAAVLHPARRRQKTTSGSPASAGPALPSTQAPAGGSTTSASSQRSSTLRAPAVSVPTVQIPTSATVAASTPVATVTATVPLSTTVAVTTPLTTVTVPVP